MVDLLLEDLPGGLSPSDRADRGQGWQRAQKSFREAVGLDPDQEVDAYSLQKVLHQSFKPGFILQYILVREINTLRRLIIFPIF